tara:strand:+ start:161 stop:619 length:459 start_codon:yes stop_codon:yes gene_type:complete
MVTFRNNNNNRRGNFRRNDRNFKTNGDRQKFSSNFSNSENFKRKVPGRNNHNAPKLIEKYNDLAREALSNGDKILSENYLQHADHFTRILNEKENLKRERYTENRTENNLNSDEENLLVSEKMSHDDDNLNKNIKEDQEEIKKSSKSSIDVN